MNFVAFGIRMRSVPLARLPSKPREALRSPTSRAKDTAGKRARIASISFGRPLAANTQTVMPSRAETTSATMRDREVLRYRGRKTENVSTYATWKTTTPSARRKEPAPMQNGESHEERSACPTANSRKNESSSAASPPAWNPTDRTTAPIRFGNAPKTPRIMKKNRANRISCHHPVAPKSKEST